MTTPIETPARALAVYAHPDDPEISAGGTLAAWSDGGCHVELLITTRGEKGTNDPDADLDALVALRREETAAAAAVLGVAGVRYLDYPDGDLLDDAELRGRIVRHVREVRPDVVLCPDPTAVFFGGSYYNHRDHRVTGWATLDAVAPSAGNPHYFPEHIAEGLAVHHVRDVYLSGTLEPNCWIDIASTPHPRRRTSGTMNRPRTTTPRTPSSTPVDRKMSCGARPARYAVMFVAPDARTASSV